MNYPDWMPARFNGGIKCDAWSGPCSCGATHGEGDHMKSLKKEVDAGIFPKHLLTETALRKLTKKDSWK